MVRTASAMDLKGFPSKDEDQWRKTFMGMHEKMHGCLQELTTQVQTLQQNANIQNRSMERIEEAIVSLTAQLSALPALPLPSTEKTTSDVPGRLQRSGVRMHETSCSPSIPKTTKASQHRLCVCVCVCVCARARARILDSGVVYFFAHTQIAGLKRLDARKVLTLR
jgi:hypothetical protein